MKQEDVGGKEVEDRNAEETSRVLSHSRFTFMNKMTLRRNVVSTHCIQYLMLLKFYMDHALM